MIVLVTCNDQPLRYDPPEDRIRPKSVIEQRYEDTAAKGFDDLAMAMAYAHVHAGYAVARSEVMVTGIPIDISKPDGGVSWEEAGPGRWEMRLGPLLYVARVTENHHG